MITINPSSSVIFYVMTVTNRQLLISDSRGNSNHCTPCRGKLKKHTMYASHSSPRTPSIRFLWAVPIHDNLSLAPTKSNRPLHPEEVLTTKGKLTQPSSWVASFFLRCDSPGVGERGFGSMVTQLLQFIGPISPACDWYIQYLFTGANPSVLNQHRRGLQPWRCQLATYHSPTLPTSCLHFPLMTPPGLQFNQVPSTKPRC
jgi:hypothetical protein